MCGDNLKRLRKYCYLILLTAMGAIYLASAENWRVYAKPLFQIKEWYQETLGRGENTVSGNYTVTAGDTESASEGEPENVSGNDITGEDSPTDAMEPDSESQEQTGTAQEQTGENGGTQETGAQETEAQETESRPGESARSPEEVEYCTVEDEYFSDAVFIGDSRTVGLYEYGGLEEISHFYASTGLTVYKLFDSPIVELPGQKEKLTVEEALSQNSFSKIYLMIGINEMGTGTVESFMEKYREVVAHLRELQPDAVIYLQAIMKVTTERSGQGDYITNEGIDARNAEIQKLADYETIYYLDVNPFICDETGGMNPDYTFDGVHLKAQYVPIWKDFLKTHVPVMP